MRFFLMAIEMAGDGNDGVMPPPPPTGIAVRAWYGVELVSLLPCTLCKPAGLNNSFPSFLVGCAP